MLELYNFYRRGQTHNCGAVCVRECLNVQSPKRTVLYSMILEVDGALDEVQALLPTVTTTLPPGQDHGGDFAASSNSSKSQQKSEFGKLITKSN